MTNFAVDDTKEWQNRQENDSAHQGVVATSMQQW